MGFNRRYINLKNTIEALNTNKLREYYGKTDVFFFDNTLSSQIYQLFSEGKDSQEIKEFLKPELTNEKDFQEN